MISTTLGIFTILHALVYLLYFGHSVRLFELRTGLAWPSESWLFSGLFEEGNVRRIAGFGCIISTVGFAAGGVAVISGFPPSRHVLTVTASFSIVCTIFFWDGRMKKLGEQGILSIIINIGIITVLGITG